MRRLLLAALPVLLLCACDRPPDPPAPAPVEAPAQPPAEQQLPDVPRHSEPIPEPLTGPGEEQQG